MLEKFGGIRLRSIPQSKERQDIIDLVFNDQHVNTYVDLKKVKLDFNVSESEAKQYFYDGHYFFTIENSFGYPLYIVSLTKGFTVQTAMTPLFDHHVLDVTKALKHLATSSLALEMDTDTCCCAYWGDDKALWMGMFGFKPDSIIEGKGTKEKLLLMRHNGTGKREKFKWEELDL